MDFSKITIQLDAAKNEVESLIKGKKISSSRARASLMNIKKEADSLRKAILAYSKDLPVKHKVHKSPEMTFPDTPTEIKAILEPVKAIVEPVIKQAIVVVPVEPVKAKAKARTSKKEIIIKKVYSGQTF
jgi:hypothetical protein